MTTAATDRPKLPRPRSATRVAPRRFVALSVALHAAAFAVAWTAGVATPRAEAPAHVAAEWAFVAEIADAPEVPPADVPDVERAAADTSIEEPDPAPMDLSWDDAPPVVAVPAADGDPLGRTTLARVRAPRGDGTGSGTSAGTAPSGTAQAAIVPAAAPPRAEPAPPAPRAAPRGVRLLRRTDPVYPDSARTSGIEGTVVLEVEVLADGTVGDVRVFESSGSHALEQAAIDAVRRWTFEPATDGEVAVASWVRLKPIVFRFAG